MKLKLNNYTIETDGIQFILKETQIIKNPKKPTDGTKTKDVILGYCGTLDRVFEKMLDNDLLTNQSESIEELKSELVQIRLMIKQSLDNLDIKEIKKRGITNVLK